MDRVNQVTQDCFNAVAQLRRLDDASMPPAESLHRRLRGFVDALFQKGQQAGFTREDVNDIAYAVVALADEVAVTKSDELRQYWVGHELQMHYFKENVAGEAFFTRLETLRRDPRRAEALRVYYLALLFGFQGRYRVRGGEIELMNLVEELERDVARGRKRDVETLSPDGEPPDRTRAGGGRGGPLLWVGAGAAAALVLLWVGLALWVGGSAGSVVGRIASANLP
jgi:type VI secretion system protein ImpK